ncbi:MAG: DUF1641 domain-containing protein [Salinivenus sp.]
MPSRAQSSPADPAVEHLDPETIRGLKHLAARADEIVFLVDMIGGAMARGPEIADNLNEGVQEMREAMHQNGSALDPEDTARAVAKLGTLATPENVEQLTATVETLQSTLSSPQVQSLLQSSILDPEAVGAVSELAEALVRSTHRAKEKPPESKGFFGLLGALRDPDVSRAIGFFVEFAKAFGQQVEHIQTGGRQTEERP